jgi:hypothetical protein
MRVVIIPSDEFVSVDGLGFNGINMSSVASNIHAVQWYGSTGEIERKDSFGRIIANEKISSISQFSTVLQAYNVLRSAYEMQKHEEEAEQTIIEV